MGVKPINNFAHQGTVLAVQANFYQVRLELSQADLPRILLCTCRTRLKKIGKKVMVGDRVIVEQADFTTQTGVIIEILPRSMALKRPAIANVEQILLIFSLQQPALDPWQVSRFLIKAESTQLEICLCLNKTDLVTKKEQQRWQERLQAWGYQPFFISVKQKLELERLKKQLENKITVVAGPSGVGKSSLINYLVPAAHLRVGKVSGKLKRGRHTTRHVELFDLPGSGLLADSPGFNQPDFDYLPPDLANYFPEIRAKLRENICQFSNCLHLDEPNCVIEPDWERYAHYCRFLEEAITYQAARQQQPDDESSLKLKIKNSGKRKYEPKLELKKYRRLSRKQTNQSLQELENQSLEDLEKDTIADQGLSNC